MKMKLMIGLALGVLASAAQAQTQYFTHYDFHMSDPALTVTNMILFERGESFGSATWPFSASDGQRISNPFPTSAPVQSTIMLGVAQNLPGDPDGQKHVVIGMDDTAASLSQGIAWGTLFRNTLEANVLDDIEAATSGGAWEVVTPALDRLGVFLDGDATTGILGPGGASQTAWFATEGTFSVMAFSDGQLLGTGTGSVEAVPEPASLAVLGLGALALRRRKSA
jgi:hypothetical protein